MIEGERRFAGVVACLAQPLPYMVAPHYYSRQIPVTCLWSTSGRCKWNNTKKLIHFSLPYLETRSRRALGHKKRTTMLDTYWSTTHLHRHASTLLNTEMRFSCPSQWSAKEVELNSIYCQVRSCSSWKSRTRSILDVVGIYVFYLSSDHWPGTLIITRGTRLMTFVAWYGKVTHNVSLGHQHHHYPVAYHLRSYRRSINYCRPIDQ